MSLCPGALVQFRVRYWHKADIPSCTGRMASGRGVCSKKQTHVTRQPNTSALTNSSALGQGRGECSLLMSAIGTKRTFAFAPHMSAIGTKRTCRVALHMKAGVGINHGLTRYDALAGNCWPGVEREISSSSSVMSAVMLANSGVLR
jgi:hypothetical protein